MVDVLTEITLPRPADEVAAYTADPTNAPAWYVNIDRADWLTEPPLAVGTRVAFVARFLGRTLSYTYEVKVYEPGRRLVMATAEGPFPMETTYTFAPVDGGTRMTLRNRGAPSGFSALVAPLMATMMRRANAADLRKLAEVLAARGPAAP